MKVFSKLSIRVKLFWNSWFFQSQGSLSELLSKPRHWNKLTDKGREAFRRIYGWVSDGKAVALLCSLAPRRIQSTSWSFALWRTIKTSNSIEINSLLVISSCKAVVPIKFRRVKYQNSCTRITLGCRCFHACFYWLSTRRFLLFGWCLY